MNWIGSYNNGNYYVAIADDGTKVRFNYEDHWTPEFPESIDLKICNRCNMNCPQCHEMSTEDGALGNLDVPFLNTLKPYTELAIGGGNPLSHPGLVPFLMRMKEQKVICSMTVHWWHFLYFEPLISMMVEQCLLHGIGISVSNDIPEKDFNLLIKTLKRYPNAVVHVIAGIVNHDTMERLGDHDLKLLILGYKDWGRGEKYLEDHPGVVQGIENLAEDLPRQRERFALICFDNLAVKQLHVQDMFGDEEWKTRYMGDDGQYTMYADLVKNEYAVSSTSERHPIVHDNITDMFQFVRELSGHAGG